MADINRVVAVPVNPNANNWVTMPGPRARQLVAAQIVGPTAGRGQTANNGNSFNKERLAQTYLFNRYAVPYGLLVELAAKCELAIEPEGAGVKRELKVDDFPSQFPVISAYMSMAGNPAGYTQIKGSNAWSSVYVHQAALRCVFWGFRSWFEAVN